MQEVHLNGQKYWIHSGTIETVGNEMTYGDGSFISVIRFTDGSIIRNLIADGGLAPYIVAGQSLKLAFVKKGKRHTLIASEIEGYGFRAADTEIMKKSNGKAMFAILFGGAVSLGMLAMASSTGLFSGMGIFVLLCGTPFYIFVAAGLATLNWS